MNPITRNQELNRKKQRGFTLVELMVVITILGLITGIVAVALFKQSDDAKWKTTKIQAKTLANAVHSFKMDCGRYPTASEGLSVLLNKPNDPEAAAGWNGPYLQDADQVPKDGWSRDFIYKYPGTDGHEFDIISYGEDGIEGQKDSSNKSQIDIYNWKQYDNKKATE